jgi:hypothetical protein
MSALLIISLILFNYLAVDREPLRASSGELLRLAWERVFDPSLDKYDYITGVCIGESRLYLLGLTQFNGSQTTFIYAIDLSSGVVVESVEVDQSLGAAGLYDCVEVDGNLYVAGTNKTALILILNSTLKLINVVKTDFFPYRDEAISLSVLGDNLYSLIYSYAELSDARITIEKRSISSMELTASFTRSYQYETLLKPLSITINPTTGDLWVSGVVIYNIVKDNKAKPLNSQTRVDVFNSNLEEKTVLQLENTTSFTASKIVFSYNGYGYLVDKENLYKVSPNGVLVKEIDCSGCLDLASSGEYIYVLKQYTGVKNGESTIELQLIIYNIDLEQEEVVTLMSLNPVMNITGFIESQRDKLLVAARVWNQSDSSDYWNLYYYNIPWREPIQYTPTSTQTTWQATSTPPANATSATTTTQQPTQSTTQWATSTWTQTEENTGNKTSGTGASSYYTSTYYTSKENNTTTETEIHTSTETTSTRSSQLNTESYTWQTSIQSTGLPQVGYTQTPSSQAGLSNSVGEGSSFLGESIVVFIILVVIMVVLYAVKMRSRR